MKIKIGLILVLSIFCFLFSISFAQEISSITSSFCNSGIITENLNLSTDSAKLNEICTQFTNNSDQDISIKIGFPDQTITDDEFSTSACKAEGNIQNFGKYIIQKDNTINIPAKQTIIEKIYIKFPAGFDGMARGCMTYFLSQSNSEPDSLLNIVVRKKNYINILVGSNFKRSISIQQFDKINNGGTNPKIYTELNSDGSLILKLNFTNSGDVDELFVGSGIIYNRLGFSKELKISQTKLSTNSTKEISINIGKLPFYKGLFKIQFNGYIKPDIDPSFDKNSLNPKLKEIIHIQEETSIKIIPRNIVITIISLIMIISIIRYFIKRKNSKQ